MALFFYCIGGEDNGYFEKIQKIKRQTPETLNDAFSIVRGLLDRAEIKKWCKWIRSETKKIPTVEMYDLTYKTYLLEAMRGDFDACCIYLEKNREPEKKFYLPRRDVLLPLVNDLQDLFDGINTVALACLNHALLLRNLTHCEWQYCMAEYMEFVHIFGFCNVFLKGRLKRVG